MVKEDTKHSITQLIVLTINGEDIFSNDSSIRFAV